MGAPKKASNLNAGLIIPGEMGVVGETKGFVFSPTPQYLPAAGEYLRSPPLFPGKTPMVAFNSQYNNPPKGEVASETDGPVKNRVIEYDYEWTPNGTWKRFEFGDGKQFAEYTSHRTLFGKPLLNYVSGKDPETNRIKTARGIVAIGRKAVGIIALGQYARGFIAIGQLAIGVIAIGQCAVGLTVGIGQLGIGMLAVGQLGIGGFVAGQFALGAILAMGQVALAWMAMGVCGVGYFGYGHDFAGRFVWDRNQQDPEAVSAFSELFRIF